MRLPGEHVEGVQIGCIEAKARTRREACDPGLVDEGQSPVIGQVVRARGVDPLLGPARRHRNTTALAAFLSAVVLDAAADPVHWIAEREEYARSQATCVEINVRRPTTSTR